MSERILVLGGSGFVGGAFCRYLKSLNLEVISTSRHAGDIQGDICDREFLSYLFRSFRPSAVINCAALINIDKCETDELASWLVNASAVNNLTQLCELYHLPFLHVSTDHYYDYGGNIGHSEDDRVVFKNNYAAHKFCGESFALRSRRSLILRTSVVGGIGSFKNYLLDWAISQISQGQKIYLYSDAWTSALEVNTFAKLASEAFLEKKIRGLYNLASQDVYSKEKLIRRVCDILNLDHSGCISTSISRHSNLRANCLGLSSSRISEKLSSPISTFDDVCRDVVSSSHLY
jgi:dTDP-4-dehydrorhamnose reductase